MNGPQTATFNSKELLEPKQKILAKLLLYLVLPEVCLLHILHIQQQSPGLTAQLQGNPLVHPLHHLQKAHGKQIDLFLDLHNARHVNLFKHSLVKDNVQYFNMGTIL